VKRLEGALADLTRTRHPTDPEIASMTHHLASVKDSRDRLAGKKVIIPEGRSSFSFTVTPLDWDLPQDPKVADLMKAFDDELAKINIANAGSLPAALPGQAVFVGTEACFECHEETRAFWKSNEHAHAWTTLVEGVILSIDDSEHYSPAQSAILADAVALHYPAIAAVLTEDDRRRLRAQALALKPAHGNAAQREARARMQQALSTAP